ncbi:exostosin family protein [Janthinobacterium sp. 17J80-10]|uniref:exostosin domain-containing protein n=1 Tax=Janthinobacterium sp. 17J80-10 TaxID=2497863 RepID=UPI001F50D01F|nr:exostosin family protein [Janthinobacterium sp. 17J80-10]
MHIKNIGNIYAYDNDWQTPAKTEQHAYEKCLGRFPHVADILYFAFPWATLIDNLNTKSSGASGLLLALDALIESIPKGIVHRFTVCQHIYAFKYVELFKKAGITELYLSHAEHSTRTLEGINIHPFPLYPVKVATDNFYEKWKPQEASARRYLYSFIGAHDSKYYRTSSREDIFELFGDSKSELAYVKRRNEWHFQRDVYDVQIKGKVVSEEFKIKQKLEEDEYLSILLDSVFSLCPSGSGPNSIRLWESLGTGTIPVILADGLRLPGDEDLWREAAVFVREKKERIEKLPVQLAALKNNAHDLNKKCIAVNKLYEKYGPGNFVEDIVALAIKKSTENSGKKVFVFDPGLKDFHTHHHIINRNVADVLKKHKVKFKVFGNRNLSTSTAEYDTAPFFKHSPYEDMQELSNKEFAQRCLAYAKDIADIVKEQGSSTAVIIHTSTASLVQGLAYAISHSDVYFSHIELQLMFHPLSFSGENINNSSPNYTRYLIALRSLKSAVKAAKIGISISSSCQSFAGLYSRMLRERVTTHPYALHSASSEHPIARKQLAVATKPDTSTQKILLFSGDLKIDKGIAWISKALPELLKSNSEAEFHLQLAKPRFHSNALEESIIAIKNLAESSNRVKLIDGYIDQQKWEELLATMDGLLIPYSPVAYRSKTSGILFEYIRNAKNTAKLVVTRDTWLHDEVTIWHLPVIDVEFGNTQDLANKIGTFNKHPSIGDIKESFPDFWRQYFGQGNDQFLVAKTTAA